MDTNKVEPDDDFESPKEGNKVCCKVSGACYDATVLEVSTKKSAQGSTAKYYLIEFPKEEEFRCPTSCFGKRVPPAMSRSDLLLDSSHCYCNQLMMPETNFM